jgi:hypothetical protein
MRAKEPVKTIASYDEAIRKEFAGNVVAKRPIASVVRTVGDN